MIPEGARCGRHPEVDAIALCARCGDFLCPSCTIDVRGGSYCEGCEELAGEAFPWERRGELGVARALALTTIGTLVRTRATFAPGFRDRSVVPALLYAIAIGWPVAWIGAAVELASLTPERAAAQRTPWIGWLSSDEGLVAQALVTPLAMVLAVGLWAVGWWLGLIVVGADRRPFTHLARAVAYVSGATAPLALLAVLPGVIELPLTLVAGLYTIVLQGRALSAITGASGWRVAAAAGVMILALAVLTFLAGMAFAAIAVL